MDYGRYIGLNAKVLWADIGTSGIGLKTSTKYGTNL